MCTVSVWVAVAVAVYVDPRSALSSAEFIWSETAPRSLPLVKLEIVWVDAEKFEAATSKFILTLAVLSARRRSPDATSKLTDT